MKSIFSFSSYRSFFKYKLENSAQRWGQKSALARHLSCQPTYISQILKDQAELSLEQAEAACQFFELTEDETRFFLFLVQRDRAGTNALQKIFDKEIKEIQKKRSTVVNRLGTQEGLKKEEQTVYYSSWYYAAIHVAVSLPSVNTVSDLEDFLKLPHARVQEATNFLLQNGLIKRTKNGLQMGNMFIRLESGSPNMSKHHTNWRMQAIDSLERETSSDLHFSGVYSLSKKDVTELKENLLEFLSETQKRVKTSKEENLMAFNIDFFDMKKSEK